MFHCGLRISEALSLTLPQVNLEALRFHAVVRKGRIVEDVSMNQTAAEALRRWLLYRKTYPRADEAAALFLSDRSRPLSVRALQRNFARYVAAAGLRDRHLTPHSLRHSCATALVGHGVPLSTVSAVLAHKKIETTKIYVRLDGCEKREAVALLDPKPNRAVFRKKSGPKKRKRIQLDRDPGGATIRVRFGAEWPFHDVFRVTHPIVTST